MSLLRFDENIFLEIDKLKTTMKTHCTGLNEAKNFNLSLSTKQNFPQQLMNDELSKDLILEEITY